MFTFIQQEWKYWLKSPMLWIFLIINTLMVMGAVSSDNILIGGGVGSVHKNAPFVVQNYYGVMSLVCLLMTTAFMNASAGRDFQYNMYQLVFSSPIHKRDYFFGKFIGAASMAVVPLLGVSLGAFIGPLMPWAEPERYGDVIWSGHLLGILSYGIPNIIITGVLLFSLAIIFRSNVVSFVGAMGILMLYVIAQGYIKDIKNEWLAGLLDPFGFHPFRSVSKYMTVDEKNAQAVALHGSFLANRLMWLGISLLALMVLYFKFSFNTKKEKAKKARKEKAVVFVPDAYQASSPDKANTLSFKLLCSFTWFEFRTVVKNPTFIIIFMIGVLNLIASLTSFTGVYGSELYPVTYSIIDTIRGAFFLFLIGIITFYTGVVVWKERDARMHEIQDAAAVKTGLLFTSKLLAVIMAVALVLASTIFIGIITQTLYGFTDYKLGVYVKYLLGYSLLNSAVLIAVSLFFHYIINNRYIAYFAFITFLILNNFLWSALEVSTNLVKYGETGTLIYSDMNAFGPFVESVSWFSVYWVFGALIVCFITYAYYVRGKELAFKTRTVKALQILKANRLALSAILLVFMSVGAFIYYNTLIVNKVTSSDESENRTKNYELQYKKYEGAAQPTIYKMDYAIDLEPMKRHLHAEIKANIVNNSGKSISEFYFTLPTFSDSLVISIPGGKLSLNDEKSGFRIYTLDKPFQSGDSMRMTVKNVLLTKGFENEVSVLQVTHDGSFFNNYDLMPIFGYTPRNELTSKNKRKELGLPVRKRMASLNDMDSVTREKSYISQDANWVEVSTTFSTDEDQIAIAPGSLIKEWKANGKRYFQYKLDKASLNFYSFLSARYEVARKKWKGIDLEVYYDKQHAVNVPNMLRSLEKSLEYYTTNFGPYYHKQARIIEFPRYQSFAQAFPGTMPYSEAIGFITDLRDVKKDDIDYVYYVVAHEMGHQYWAHQIIGPEMQGSELMSEGFAQYSALMVMEKEYGKDKMKSFLEYEMDRYLSGRSAEFEAERPLIKTEHQSYIHYQKASVVMYYLKEMIGEQKVNRALKSLIDSFAYKNPPYPTANMALNAFKQATPDSLQYMIADLFENITLFDNRLVDASYKKVGSEYEVIIKTSSEKFYADSLGKETKRNLQDYIDIGVFGVPTKEEEVGKPLVMQRVKLTQKENTFTFKLKEPPIAVGIDPYHYLVDRIPKDNIKKL